MKSIQFLLKEIQTKFMTFQFGFQNTKAVLLLKRNEKHKNKKISNNEHSAKTKRRFHWGQFCKKRKETL